MMIYEQIIAMSKSTN